MNNQQPIPICRQIVDELAKNPRFTREEAATYLDVQAKTLANWASTGRYGLKFYKVGRRVVYLKSDLDAWLAERGMTQTT